MPAKEADPLFDPIVRLLVVEAGSHTPVRATGVVLTFAHADKAGRPRTPLEEGNRIALVADDRNAEVPLEDDGVVMVDLRNVDRNPGLFQSTRQPDRTECWPARVEILASGYLPAHSHQFNCSSSLEHTHRERNAMLITLAVGSAFTPDALATPNAPRPRYLVHSAATASPFLSSQRGALHVIQRTAHPADRIERRAAPRVVPPAAP